MKNTIAVEYSIVTSTSPETMVAEVNEAMKEGFQPHGPLNILFKPNGDPAPTHLTLSGPHTVYTQPMVRSIDLAPEVCCITGATAGELVDEVNELTVSGDYQLHGRSFVHNGRLHQCLISWTIPMPKDD